MGLSDRKENIVSCLYPNRIVFTNTEVPQNVAFLKRFEPLPEQFNNSHFNLLEVPCGKCVNCRLRYSTEWANRCCLEASLYPKNYNWFITLTYSDDNLPLNELDNATLRKKDLSNFIKRLRSYFRDNHNFNGVRFYASGEYSDALRPHYHLILFNCPLDLFNDFKYYKTSKDGNELFTSEKLESLWSFGYVVIGNFSWQSSAYVARYVMKKRLGIDADFYKQFEMAPEFSIMSRRPGIARPYLEKHIDEILKSDKLVIEGGKVITIPKYFDFLLKGYDLDKLMIYQEQRLKESERSKASILAQTNLDEFEYNEVVRTHKEQSVKSLKRKL